MDNQPLGTVTVQVVVRLTCSSSKAWTFGQLHPNVENYQDIRVSIFSELYNNNIIINLVIFHIRFTNHFVLIYAVMYERKKTAIKGRFDDTFKIVALMSSKRFRWHIRIQQLETSNHSIGNIPLPPLIPASPSEIL